jgi:hypothetical protein
MHFRLPEASDTQWTRAGRSKTFTASRAAASGLLSGKRHSLTLHGVECEQVQPIFPEAYVCRWKDRNTLVLALLSQGKGSRTTDHPGIEGAKGILARRYAMVTVEKCE